MAYAEINDLAAEDASSSFVLPKLSLYFFASTDSYAASEYFDFIIRASVLADEMGLESIWLPERHFVQFGGFSPNPAVLGAAIAARTKNIKIRAGSIAAPLHNVVRIAEDWSIIDNISNGRVGISLASGWNEVDFVLASSPHSVRKEFTIAQLDMVAALWAGEAIELPDPDGKRHKVSLASMPTQKVLPIWLTAAGNPSTFEIAGTRGVGVMTALFGQTVRQLRKNVDLYRKAIESSQHPGHVAVMIHGCVSEDPSLKDLVRPAMKKYLASYSAQVSSKVVADEVAEMAFEDYFDGPSLLGSAEKARGVLRKLGAIGVDEVGVLVDFGLPLEFVLANLARLGDLAAVSGGEKHHE
jgi:natural product biosynthesis luciferase-like monooxygenase protein